MTSDSKKRTKRGVEPRHGTDWFWGGEPSPKPKPLPK